MILSKLKSLLVLLPMLTVMSAEASSLRCERGILQKGIHIFEVNELCGAPVAEFSRVEQQVPGFFIQVDELVYEVGKTRFRRLLRFENGRLRSIRNLRKPESTRGSSLHRGSRSAQGQYRISY